MEVPRRLGARPTLPDDPLRSLELGLEPRDRVLGELRVDTRGGEVVADERVPCPPRRERLRSIAREPHIVDEPGAPERLECPLAVLRLEAGLRQPPVELGRASITVRESA